MTDIVTRLRDPVNNWNSGGRFEAADAIEELEHMVDYLGRRVGDLEDALHKIASWSRAYPLTVFPEPDFKKAAELLKSGGMTLDAISASCMRHVIEGVGKIARGALEQSERER